MTSRTGPVFVELMANDYENEKSDLHGSAEAADTDRPAMDDPLLELARIVHKNNQLGANVSSGRVGSTDYFAGLDDFADDAVDTSGSQPQRVEPSFPDAGFKRENIERSPHGPDNHPAPIVGEIRNQFFARSGDESAQPAAEAPSLDTPQRGGESAENVSPLWPKFTNPQADAPTSFSPPGASIPDTPVEPFFEPQALQPEAVLHFTEEAGSQNKQPVATLSPNFAMDIEQSLTAELEDELIGALRQSVDEETGTPSQETVDDVSTADTFADITEAVDHQDVRSGIDADVPLKDNGFHRNEKSATPNVTAKAAAPFQETEPAAYPDAAEVRSASADLSATPQVIGEKRAADGLEDRRRPEIDENDFFAALNTQDTAGAADTGTSMTRGAKESPAGIDALFADLDFPEREKRPPIEIQPDFSEPEPDPVVSADDIDDMAWPAAANAVPDVEEREDETAPPPEGYDLDAVARAMQESDPSLSGAGVLPPHSETERVVAEQAAGKSRRGLYVALGVVGVAALGGAGFFLYDGNSVQVPSGPPPVISGLQEPLKIFPSDSQSNAAGQSATKITDRLQSTGESVPERLNIQETPQPVELPPAPASSEGDSELAPGTPKQVRTVIVRPDGTIVSGDDAPVISTPTSAEAPTLQAPEVSAPSVIAEAPQTALTETVNAVPVQTEPIVVAPQTQNTTETETVAVEPQVVETPEPAPVAVETAAVETAAPAVPEIVTQTQEPVQAETEAAAPAAPVPTVVPRKKPQAPVQVAAAPVAQSAPAAQTAPAATQQQDAPSNLANTGNAQTQQAAPASGSIPSGTYIVQVTSQRSAAAARDAYAGLQRSYPGVLGNRNAVIVSADLGDRGVFYRARIPTGSRSEANTLCESLKGAGGDCFVRRQP